MNDNINIKELWLKQNVGEPNLEELLTKLNKYKNSNMRKLILTNCLLIGTMVYIIYVWVHYQPEFVSTKLGIIMVILAMVVFLSASNKTIFKFNKIDNTQSTNDYLQSLIRYNNKQKYIQKTILSTYFAMLSIGLALYLYEFAIRMTWHSALLTYSITFAWILFNWFFTRPRTIRKQQKKLDELIEKFEKLGGQLSNDL